ncbi:hypothetical protein LOAG_01328 [Loa loa]|uniref:Uncharacterized protein n=1 Tax=Loa loa TaxID=7209 RepID=A0A1S0U943_LOALO|nr:hypothetical protein LOAG_01328 [Loa loa]EFO27154.1 hypothetical protein LOAG_01328 [Loa loa]
MNIAIIEVAAKKNCSHCSILHLKPSYFGPATKDNPDNTVVPFIIKVLLIFQQSSLLSSRNYNHYTFVTPPYSLPRDSSYRPEMFPPHKPLEGPIPYRREAHKPRLYPDPLQ